LCVYSKKRAKLGKLAQNESTHFLLLQKMGTLFCKMQKKQGLLE
jgi:hypothetical protein